MLISLTLHPLHKSNDYTYINLSFILLSWEIFKMIIYYLILKQNVWLACKNYCITTSKIYHVIIIYIIIRNVQL